MAIVFPNNMETMDAAHFSVNSLQSVLQRPNLKKEIKHHKKVLRDINGYPNWIIEQTIEKSKKIKTNSHEKLGQQLTLKKSLPKRYQRYPIQVNQEKQN